MHALVVGGTGMLRPVVHYLIKTGWQVSVIAKTERSLNILRDEISSECYLKSESKTKLNRLYTFAVDYANTEQLQNVLKSMVTIHEPITLTIAWIHSSSPEAVLTVAQAVEGDFFQIRSAIVSQKSYQDPFDIASVQKMTHLNYYRIILGFQMDDYSTRWLTNKEIADGVIAALQSKQGSNIIGVVEPWGQRPS